MISKIYSSALHGIDAFRITIEVNIGRGVGYQFTGQPDDAVKESLSRIDVALNANGYHMPRTKLSVNLAPADVRKSGTAYDLPIAIGILLASGQINDFEKLSDYTMAGELGLDGSIYPVRGALCMAYQARRDKFKGILLPAQNASEAALIDGIDVYGISHLRDLVSFIKSDIDVSPRKGRAPNSKQVAHFDFKDVRGQHNVKRALEITAAGGHNALLIGPPGIGKTMLAKRLPSILPPMSIAEALDTTRIYSVANNGGAICGLITERPFRNPHHTCSDTALAGGGSIPMPGEISLAHNGVLFLDELPEFKRSVIEVMRQPLEERKVVIARTKMTLAYPASFMLLAAMNPCLCGYFGHPSRPCTCSKRALYWYRRKISGPLLERIDLHVEVEPVPIDDLMNSEELEESSTFIRERVVKARNIQSGRYLGNPEVHCNAEMNDADIVSCCDVDGHAKKFLVNSMQRLQLSARSYTRILKVARTIADLAGSQVIELQHVAEAIHFRSLDKPLIISPSAKNSPQKNNYANKDFRYKKAFRMVYQSCSFHSLLELKYVVSIEDNYKYLREAVVIYYDPKTLLPTCELKDETRKYTPDFVIRNISTGEAFVIEVKPRAFSNQYELERRRTIVENYISWKKLDWGYKLIFDDEIRLSHLQQEKFKQLCTQKRQSAGKIAMQARDKDLTGARSIFLNQHLVVAGPDKT